jgi:transposase-like protein
MKRRQHSNDFKAKAVLEAIRGEETINLLAKRYNVHPLMVTKWKKHAVSLLPTLFSRKEDKVNAAWEKRESELFEQIGKLKFELEWLKKKTSLFNQ